VVFVFCCWCVVLFSDKEIFPSVLTIYFLFHKPHQFYVAGPSTRLGSFCNAKPNLSFPPDFPDHLWISLFVPDFLPDLLLVHCCRICLTSNT